MGRELNNMTLEINLDDVGPYMSALHCGIRWTIIEILQDGSKSSDEIFKILKDIEDKDHLEREKYYGRCKKDSFENLQKQSLYYHLRELESVGIIVLAEYKTSIEGRAPEKVWKLNLEKLIINFVK